MRWGPRHGTAIGAGRLETRLKSIRSETIAAHSKELGSRARDVSEGLAAELFDVGTLSSNLEIVADWRDELLRKLDRASLRFELIIMASRRPQISEIQ